MAERGRIGDRRARRGSVARPALLAALALAGAAACGKGGPPATGRGGEALPLWVTPEQLEAHLASGSVLLFDSRPLADYRLGHVAQARPLPLDEFAPVEEDSDAPEVVGAREGLRAREGFRAEEGFRAREGLRAREGFRAQEGFRAREGFDDAALRRLAAALGAAGFDPDAEMVVTDGGGPGGLRRAAAGCWLLALAGATRCAVLPGGVEAWRAAGGAPVVGRPAAGTGPTAPQIPARPPGLATPLYLREATARPEGAIVDVRSPGRSRDAASTAGGHDGWIPGALSWPLPDPEPTDRRARAAAPFDLAALERAAAAAGLFAERDLVVVGESFHDGALGWFLLRYGLGVRDAKLFPGGIAAWRRDPSLPFATAAAAAPAAAPEAPAVARAARTTP